MPMRKMSEQQIWFRWNKKNRYTIAALLPLLNGARLTDEPRPGIMLYSIATPQAEEVYREVDAARASGIDAIFIAGGPHPSARPIETLEHFDYVVIGEGEETLPELIEAIRTGRDVEYVRGIAYLREGKPVITERREFVDLDRYPSFTYPLLAPIEISRGCPWRCAYCQTPRLCGSRMRHRSISSILKHARSHLDLRFTTPNALAYGSDGIKPRLEKVEELLATLSKLGRPIYFGTFPSEVRPDFVSEEALEIITEYCTNRTLSIGGQSGSDRILKEIDRGHGVHEIERACEISLDYGITPNVDLILCLPGESEEDQLLTVELAEWIVRIGGRVRAHRFMPLPGTPLELKEPAPLSREAEMRLGRLALAGDLKGRLR